jgi:hypothetical protein
MIYFANPTANPAAHDAMRAGLLGFIDTPGQGYRHVREPGMSWCADNGCFNGAKFNEDRWWRFLVDNSHAAGDCVFATAPDVVGDHLATLERSRPWLPRIRELGYPVALVAQDGSTPDNTPWDEFDVLFLGGTTDWKLGLEAQVMATHAKSLGMWVHLGRCNSGRRLRFAEAIGCDSADGTYLVFGPDVNFPRLMRWVNDLRDNPALFNLTETK